MAFDSNGTEYRALLEAIGRAHGPSAAAVTQALAELHFAIDATNALIADIQENGKPTFNAVLTVRAVWEEARDELQRALLLPLTVGLDAESAALLAGMLRETSKVLSRMPLTDPAPVH
jgi:hypothetical protein